MQQELVLETPDQVSALAHPLRLRALNLLYDQPRTNSQLADALGESRARLHFHVRELERAGLIELVEERPKGGVIEKYYLAVARYFRLAPSLTSSSPALQEMPVTTWETARQVLVRAIEQYGGPPPDLRSAQYQFKLSPAAFARVQEHLRAIDEEFHAEPPNGEGTPVSLAYFFHRLPE